MRVLRVFAAACVLVSSMLTRVNAAPPATDHPLRVAFVISNGFNVIDFAGPWEVFQDTVVEPSAAGGEAHQGFEIYTVSASSDAVTSTGGARVIPSFTFASAPRPDIVMIGAQSDNSPQLLAWLRSQYEANATIASVCTGARKLALSGLIDGKNATTHHDYIAEFRDKYPAVHWVESRRFVHSGERLYSAGGTTSGIELALHLVAQRFDRKTAQAVADYMEYRGQEWAQPD